MKGIQKNKAHKTDKQIPGCLGRMVNLFDLSAGASASRLLMDKPYRDGSLSRSRSDAARTLGTPTANKLEDKMVYPDLRSLPYRNSHSIPMKMLIAQEMSKQIKSKHGQPNVVAKLMGLDALPRQQHDVVTQRAQSKDYSHRSLSYSGEPAQYWPQEHDYLDKRMKWKAHDYEDYSDYRDVYEVRREYQRTNSLREKSQQKGMYSEKESKKKIELVRQKFMEAKRLAANEKLCQSKEFQDAVEVLSSNKELFLEFLQEPNGLMSEHLYDLQSFCAPPETKRITVLKPSKMIGLEKFPTRGKKNDYPIRRPAQVVQETRLSYDADDYADQPTRIVVLKPNAAKMCEIKSSVSVSSRSPRMLHGENTFEAEDYRIRESRDVIEENLIHANRKLMGDQRDETLISSGFGEMTSFNYSGNQYAVESFNDFEVMSPNSRHSWDCHNGFGSPFSSSSFNRMSYCPDSSVRQEAKKRLSERWAMMASSGGSQETRRWRGSNTLGEMLALSDMKKSSINNEEGNGREELGTGGVLDKGDAVHVPGDLQRSKSLPASSSEYRQMVYPELSVREANKTNSVKEITKKSSTSSFKGKVSSFFFPRKRSSKDKCVPSLSIEESQSAASDIPESSVSTNPHNKFTYYVNEFAEDSQPEECSSPGIGFSDRSFPGLAETGQKQRLVPKGEMSNLKSKMRGSSIENPDQPSPISVLELPYEDDDTATPEASGKQLPMYNLMSNLINKSPPIESIARSLSWDDSCSESGSPIPSHCASHELTEQDWLLLIRKILFAAGIDEETQWDMLSFNWHSPEIPLDPVLRDRITSLDEDEPPHEAKRRQQRLIKKLIFDCVNEALSEIVSQALEPVGVQGPTLSSGEQPSAVLDRVWALVSEWRSCQVARDECYGHSLAVEMAVREEVVVVGRGWWAEKHRFEIGEVGKEIEQDLLRELVDETLIGLL